jgi:methylenetetrahydrofolate dehydrogenase (NADP+)/methenyltetrahydrofolate cyclohydrolase
MGEFPKPDNFGRELFHTHHKYDLSMSGAPISTVVMAGAPARDAILAGLAARITKAGSPHIALATVLVGDDAPSRKYVASKHTTAQSIGIESVQLELPATTTQTDLEAAVSRLATDPRVHGILVQLPLPSHLDTEAVLRLIPAEKDVDGLTEASLGRLVRDVPGHIGCTPLGVLRLLQHYGIPTSGKHAVVIGRSTLVGLPLSVLLARKGIDATVTLAHSRTENLEALCKTADIVISATGVARSITAAHVSPGATVIDVGISRTESGIVGDVDAASVTGIAGALTPMPGGTGIMTVACLMENTVNAAVMQGVVV